MEGLQPGSISNSAEFVKHIYNGIKSNVNNYDIYLDYEFLQMPRFKAIKQICKLILQSTSLLLYLQSQSGEICSAACLPVGRVQRPKPQWGHWLSEKNKREISSAGSEHLPYKQGVTGSNPVSPTLKIKGLWSKNFVNPFFLQKNCKNFKNKNENEWKFIPLSLNLKILEII